MSRTRPAYVSVTVLAIALVIALITVVLVVKRHRDAACHAAGGDRVASAGNAPICVDPNGRVVLP